MLQVAGSRASPISAGRLSQLQFWIDHLFLPLLVSLLLLEWLIGAGGDLWLAKQLFGWLGDSWTLKHAFVTETLIHRGGRSLTLLVWLMLLVPLAVARWRGNYKPWHRAGWYLVASVLCSTALVAGLKRVLQVDCPWDVGGLGGVTPYLTLFDPRPLWYPTAHCFPAGHASTGYAWLALYFAGFPWPRARWMGLAIGMGAGLTFGIAQQLRGAHFASHDVWTALICWCVALALTPMIGRGRA